MLRLLQFFSQERFISIDFYKKYIIYKIPLHSDMIKKIINIKIINNEIVIKTSVKI